MKFLVACLLTCLYFTCYSQKGKVNIKFCPLALINDFHIPAVAGGIELKLSDRITWYNELGIKYRKSYIDSKDSSFIQSGGFQLKSEIRLYFNSGNSLPFEGHYAALTAFLSKDSHNTEVGYHQIDSITGLTDVFGVQKKMAGFNFLYGYQKTFYKRFMFDAFAGISIRSRSIRTIYQEFNKQHDGLNGPIDFNIPFMLRMIDTENGHAIVPALSSGIRICYKL